MNYVLISETTLQKLIKAIEAPNHGGWGRLQARNGEIFYECSVCKIHCYTTSDYCPMCGAKMDLNYVETAQGWTLWCRRKSNGNERKGLP